MTTSLEDILTSMDPSRGTESGEGGDRTYIGPATVTGVDTGRVEANVNGQIRQVGMTVGLRYEPDPGDVLLVAGQADRWYAIGVIRGSGRMVFSAPGDLELRSQRGGVSVKGARGLHLSAPRITMTADSLRMIAERVTESLGSVQRRVRDAVKEHVGRYSLRVEGLHRIRGKRLVHQATEEVKLKGKRIHLG